MTMTSNFAVYLLLAALVTATVAVPSRKPEWLSELARKKIKGKLRYPTFYSPVQYKKMASLLSIWKVTKNKKKLGFEPGYCLICESVYVTSLLADIDRIGEG